jgi:tetratricopeptide (TPR) repeat protein
MPIAILISTVSDEFRAYRDQLEGDLTRHNVAVKVQEHFKDLGGDTLDKLDVYIAHCDGVVHLVGHMTGSAADERQQHALLGKHTDLSQRLPPLGEALKSGARLAYTQWEAWLALYHGKPLMIAQAGETAPREASYAPTQSSRAAQVEHLKRLKAFHRYPGSEFGSPDELAKQIAYAAILDLLVAEYAQKEVRERDVAVGFIREMAKRVAGDTALDFEGMKQQVQRAIELYETEIAGRPLETNLDDIVNRALARAKEQVDLGQSRLARATLRRAAEEMRREEEKRRERFDAGVTALYTQARDVALAAYDGDAAAEAIIELAHSIHGVNPSKIAAFLTSEAQALYEYGCDRGSNVHLVAAIALRKLQVEKASGSVERGGALYELGRALWRLGERESGTARLEEAVSSYRAALEERSRERVPLDWATTQNNLGVALETLGERESETSRFMEAVVAYRAALEERTREQVPLDWAATQMNLGIALLRLGERESGTAQLEKAVAAFRAALEELTRERRPLNWAATQNNLGLALFRLGERERGTARVEEAVVAYRAALEERTRERVPLDWAATQMNLGSALRRLGERESGTARLEEAVQTYRAALEERRRERVPLAWAETQMNLGVALETLGGRESGTSRLEEAVAACRAALEERTRGRVPLDWAMTQYNLGVALLALGARENGTMRLEQAVRAFSAALEERTQQRVQLEWAASLGSLGVAFTLIAKRTNDLAVAKQAVGHIQTAYDTTLAGGQEPWSEFFLVKLLEALSVRNRLMGQ